MAYDIADTLIIIASILSILVAILAIPSDIIKKSSLPRRQPTNTPVTLLHNSN